jgi:probable rRNA maturation factor
MAESALTVHVQVDPAIEQEVAPAALRRAANAAFRAQHSLCEAELTVVLTSDAHVEELNKAYRGVESPTDVLAFGSAEPTSQFVEAPSADAYLGDVVISLPRAQAQTAEFGLSLEEELSVLVVHGTLHLLGYDHEAAEGREEMWRLQGKVLQLLGVDWKP